MKQLDKVLKALADPNRLRILNILLQQETCVCDMQTMLELPQPLLSRHLAYLRNAELVQDRRDGTRVFYSLTLDDEVGDALREFLEKVFPLFEIFQTDSTNMRALIERGQCSGIVSTEFPTQPSHQSTGEVNRSHV